MTDGIGRGICGGSIDIALYSVDIALVLYANVEGQRGER